MKITQASEEGKTGAAIRQGKSGTRLSDSEAQELLRLFVEGDQGSFDVLIEAFSPMIYSIFLHWYKLSMEDSEDLFQETMLQMVIKADTITNVRAWLQGTAVNQAKKRIRRLIRDRNLAQRVIDRGEVFLSQHGMEEKDLIERGLAKLTEHEGKLLRLLFVEGMSYQETADILGRPIGSIGPMRVRTLGKFAEIIRRVETPTQPVETDY